MKVKQAQNNDIAKHLLIGKEDIHLRKSRNKPKYIKITFQILGQGSFQFQDFQGFSLENDGFSRFSRLPSLISRFSRFSRSGINPDKVCTLSCLLWKISLAHSIVNTPFQT